MGRAPALRPGHVRPRPRGALAPSTPSGRTKEPFKAVLTGDREAMAKFTEQDWERIIAATHAGMTTEAFSQIVEAWLAKAKDPRFKRPYTELVYQPMLEVMEYLRENGFRTYIVTGGGQEFVRVYSEGVYGVPVEQVVGSSIATKYEYQDGKPVLMREPKVFFIDDKAGKPIGINLFIGKRPYAAFGNSGGDREMLEWTGGRRRRAADDAGAPRRRRARIRLRPGERPAGQQGRHLLPGARGRGEGEGLGRDQHEERLEDDLSGGGEMSRSKAARCLPPPSRRCSSMAGAKADEPPPSGSAIPIRACLKVTARMPAWSGSRAAASPWATTRSGRRSGRRTRSRSRASGSTATR